MARTTGMFVHVLLFECPKCGDPIPAHLVAPDSNMETVDGSNFDLQCPATGLDSSSAFARAVIG